MSTTGMEVITPHNTRLEVDTRHSARGACVMGRRAGLTWKTADEAGFPGGLLPADNNNFAPATRRGIPADATRWVLRGGYGIYYWTMPLSQILAELAHESAAQSADSRTSLNDLNGEEQISRADARSRGERVHRRGDSRHRRNRGHQQQCSGDDAVGHPQLERQHGPGVDVHHRARADAATPRFGLSYIGNHGSNLEQRWRWNDPESEYNYQARTGLLRPANPDLRRVNPNWTSGCCNAPVRHNGYSNTTRCKRRSSAGIATVSRSSGSTPMRTP